MGEWDTSVLWLEARGTASLPYSHSVVLITTAKGVMKPVKLNPITFILIMQTGWVFDVHLHIL